MTFPTLCEALKKHTLPWRVSSHTPYQIVDAKGGIVFTGVFSDQTSPTLCKAVCQCMNQLLCQDDGK